MTVKYDCGFGSFNIAFAAGWDSGAFGGVGSVQIETLMAEPVIVLAAGLVGLALLALLIDAVMSNARPAERARSPIVLMSDPVSRTALASARPKIEMPEAAEPEPAPIHVQEAAPDIVRDPLYEQRRFFTTLGAALTSTDEATQATMAALHANLSADAFMERMAMATKGWRPDGFGTGARNLMLKADGTPPDTVADRVLEGYEQLKAGHAKEALEAFLIGIEEAKVAAGADASSPWPHAWSAYAWRGLALIAEESGDVQATLAGLKVAYQSMVNAYEITMPAEAA
jgi:hypothetical protein